VGNNGLFLIEVELDGIVNYTWLDIVEVNNSYWNGQTGIMVIERELGFGDHMYVLPEELTELNAHLWSGHVEYDGSVTLSDDDLITVVGDASIKYETDGGWDTWMRFPGSGNARWNMSDLQSIAFWVRTHNDNWSFQNNSPWIYLICADGKVEYHPNAELLNDAQDTWVEQIIPAEGNATWIRTVHGNPDLSQVQAMEFHADTWDTGFTMWVDGLHFDLGSVAVTEIPVPARLSLSQNAPNPFNPTTTINFALPKAGEVRLTVYDASGRRLRTLIDEQRETGRYSVNWDGRDDHGAGQGSGVYFYRLEAGETGLTRKMVLLK
jgi:hypothetical protein